MIEVEERQKAGIRAPAPQVSPEIDRFDGGSAGLLSPAHSTPLANPGAVREGLRHMLRRDSPFSMRPRPGLLLWLLRFMAAARADRVAAGTEVLRQLSFSSLELHQALGEGEAIVNTDCGNTSARAA